MLSRLRLSSKMVLAAAPLVAVLIGLLTLTVDTNVEQINEAGRTGKLGSTWAPLVQAIEAVDAEQDVILRNDTDTATARLATDAAFADLNRAVGQIPDAGALDVTVADAESSLGRARATQDAGGGSARAQVFAEYATTQQTLTNLGDLLAAEATDTELGRKLQAVAALTRAAYNTEQLLEMIDLSITTGQPINEDRADLLRRNALFALERFEASAPDDWYDIYERRNLPATTEASIAELDWLLEQETITPAVAAQFDMQRFSAPIVSESGLRNLLAEQVTGDAEARSSSIAQQTFTRIGYVTAAILVALLLSYLTARSITRRMARVSDRAREVAHDQLPTLVESLRDPSGATALPEVTPIEGVGSDEIGELAESFTAVQATLVDVAAEQMDVLRRGVADIFVTLARRNRSLVDRQLAMLDDLEANVDDPELLSDYYKLDHLATRMRRSAESLLVLANSDTQRRRSGPVEVDDVVRAAISEVEDYRRIDVLALESLQIKGPLVADTSHLLAELLDNAASFSPPDSRVAVAGHFTGTGYLITISDRGVGIPGERLQELNDLLAKPPVIGLSVEPTLGLTVVSLLAAKHDIRVSLVQAAPGISVNIVIPPSMYQHAAEVEAPPAFEASEPVPTPSEDAAAPATPQATDEDAVRATSSALDAIAALNRAHEAQAGSRDATTELERNGLETPASDLPKRQPAGGDLPRRADAGVTEQGPADAPAPGATPDGAPQVGDLPQRQPATAGDITSELLRPQPAAAEDITSELPRRRPADTDSGADELPRREPAGLAADGAELPQRSVADLSSIGGDPILPITPDGAPDEGDGQSQSSPSEPTVDATAPPTIIEPAPQPLVPDFRPGPVGDPVLEPPVMPAPTPGDVRIPDLAPPPAPEPARADLTSSGLPLRNPGEPEPLTDAGLPRREAAGPVPADEPRPVAASKHDPDALRSTLSAFHTSTQLGRLEGSDAPTPQPAGGED